jgi:hypothetical protein
MRPVDPVEVKFDALADAARREGYRFVDRLVDDWISGTNRFSEPGEILLGVFDEAELIAVGGLIRDPFGADDSPWPRPRSGSPPDRAPGPQRRSQGPRRDPPS